MTNDREKEEEFKLSTIVLLYLENEEEKKNNEKFCKISFSQYLNSH
jgi:hypothetical protein